MMENKHLYYCNKWKIYLCQKSIQKKKKKRNKKDMDSLKIIWIFKNSFMNLE